jgi:hypothetical protein
MKQGSKLKSLVFINATDISKNAEGHDINLYKRNNIIQNMLAQLDWIIGPSRLGNIISTREKSLCLGIHASGISVLRINN